MIGSGNSRKGAKRQETEDLRSLALSILQIRVERCCTSFFFFFFAAKVVAVQAGKRAGQELTQAKNDH